MKNLIIVILTILIVVSCTSQMDTQKRKAVSVATRYVLTKMNSGKAYTDTNGVVSIADSMVRFIIDPASVFSGLVDSTSHSKWQLWVTIDSFHNPFLMPDYHLILEPAGDSLKITRVIRSDARILSIKAGIITAEVPTHDPSSPLYYCSECRDTVLFKLNGESLVLFNPVLH